MWICEKCGTENEGYVCAVCGATQEEWEQPQKKEKSYLPLILSLCVLVLALVVLLATMLINMNREEETQHVQVTKVIVTPAPTPTPIPAETYVPQDVQVTETAELTEHAIVNDVPTSSRRNIYLTNVEEYISKTIRPRCNEIAYAESRLPKRDVRDGVSKLFADDTMERSSAESVVCVTYEDGTDGVPYARKYYFDALTNEFMFAFIFHGAEEEHRLYFYKNALIRYKAPDETETDNPTDTDMLEMADMALAEAYAGR